MRPSHYFRKIKKFCFRLLLRIHVFLLIFVCSLFIFAFVFVFHRYHSSRDNDVNTPHFGTFRLVDNLLDEALHVSLLNAQNYEHDGRPHASQRGADAHPRASAYQAALAGSVLQVQVDLDTLRAQACQILRGKSVILVGPHETLYQLHSYLLTVLHPDPNSTIAPTMRQSCPGGTLPYPCPSHPLCYPIKLSPQSSLHSGSGSDTNYDRESPTLADIRSTNNSNNSLLRFLNSGNLNPSPTQEEDVQLFIDPRTGVRVIDSRWVRFAASSKADILVLNRGPLPAPSWSYNKNNDSDSPALNLTWLTTLRALEQKHAVPLSDLFLDVLSRLDRYWHDHDHVDSESAESDFTKLVIDAALYSTISTFLPWLLSTLNRLREHAGHRPILGTKPVLWYGSWFLPVSCASDSLSVFSSSESDDPRRLLAQLLTQAEAMNNPWSAYYNAQGSYDIKKIVYMHDRLLARLLPAYGVIYISSLTTIAPLPEVGQTYHQGERWSCIRRVFETPRGLLMGQQFLRDFIDVLSSWN